MESHKKIEYYRELMKLAKGPNKNKALELLESKIQTDGQLTGLELMLYKALTEVTHEKTKIL